MTMMITSSFVVVGLLLASTFAFGAPRINHFTTIGMPICHESGSEDNFCCDNQAIFSNQANNVDKVPLSNNDDGCFYYVCKSKSGAQLWGSAVVQSTSSNQFGGFVPHFWGKSRVKICVMTAESLKLVENEDDKDFARLDGSFWGVLDDSGNAFRFLQGYGDSIELLEMVVAGKGDKGVLAAGYGFTIPETRESFLMFSFDCPNFGFFSGSATPRMVTIQLAGFAQEIGTYDSVQDYESSRDMTPLGDSDVVASLASQSFSSGNFIDKNKHSEAMIVGHVVETELKTNEFTGQSFYWALVDIGGGMKIDIVIHPHLLEQYGQKPPAVGGVVRCYCWLSGLLLGFCADEHNYSIEHFSSSL